MAGAFGFLRCVADEFRDKGVRYLAGLVPLGENLYDFSAGVLGRWNNLKKSEGVAKQDQAIQALRRATRSTS